MRTNMFASSMMLVGGSVASSVIVTDMLDGVPNAAPPVGLDRVKVIASGPSTNESWLSRIVMGLLVSPAAKFKVPSAAVKSHFGDAKPLAVEHGKPESPFVA